MSKLFKTLMMAAALSAGVAQAHEEAPETSSKTRSQATNDFYVGVGLFNDMANVNFETVTDHGNFMFRVGRFKDVDESVAVNMSWRRPIEPNADDEYDGHTSGYYVGLFAGQLAGEMFAGDYLNRLGAGAEMGYHWVKDYTRAEFTIGLGAMKSETKAGVTLSAEPTIFFSANIALGY